ncbi:MAG: GGDEF domain-containing protein [Candidatus Limnocylindrales bacterium]
MQVGTLLALLLAMIVVNVVLLAFVAIPRRRPVGEDATPSAPPVERIDRTSPRQGELGMARDPEQPVVDGVPTATYDRVVRIVSLVFILSTSTIVVVTGLWPETEAAILVLLALGGLFVLAIHDVLPTRLLGPARFIAEGSLAITFVALLVALTGREESPFFFGFALVIVGAALVVEARVTVVLTVAAIVGYLTAVGIRPEDQPLDPAAIAAIGINVSALIFLAYVAMVVAREQRRSRDAAIRQSSIDSLTGLFNRSYFFTALEREIQRTARSDRGFCLLMLDLDGLKAINDHYGHYHGDRTLRLVGETIQAGVRRIDTAARYGGDEFVAVLPETDPTGAFVVAEKIRRTVSDQVIEGPGFAFRASLSIGVVVYPGDGETVDELMIAADRAMYTSKRQGRDRVAGSFTARTGAGPDAGDPPAGSDDRPAPDSRSAASARPATDEGRIDGIAVMVPRVVPRPGQTG